MNAKISMDESMRKCMRSLEDVAGALVGGDKLMAADFGDHPGTAWEVRQELLAGSPLLEWSALTPLLKDAIEGLVSEAALLPEAAFQEAGVRAFRHQAWVGVRTAAERFLKISADFPVEEQRL